MWHIAPGQSEASVMKGILPMGIRDLFEGSHALILIVVIVALFGWKRMPDAARGLGRSMRIFKSEMNEMKNDGKSTTSDASSHPAAEQAGAGSEPTSHNPPPA
jgi:sec-independent protein translocase protein TatA